MSVACPTELTKHDSAQFKETAKEDQTIDFESEGGWSVTRPRYTRRTPRLFTLGFTDISNADKLVLQDLYVQTRGSSDMITDWPHPIGGELINVRFQKGSKPEFVYRGMGGNHRWNVSGIILEEV